MAGREGAHGLCLSEMRGYQLDDGGERRPLTTEPTDAREAALRPQKQPSAAVGKRTPGRGHTGWR
jgi:hypothetical protein